MDGQNKRGLRWIAFGKFEKRRPTFFQIYVSLYQNIIYTARKSSSVVICGLDFAIERLEHYFTSVRRWNEKFFVQSCS